MPAEHGALDGSGAPPPSPEAWIVVDLAFGDSGKGTVTDWIVRARGAQWVVRWNGGAQAGHNVVLEDGRHHTFSQLGAGTFVPGVRTFLSEHVIVHPTALLVEARRLGTVGVTDALERLAIDERARIVTPFHQAANRLRELARGTQRHGTCGVGVGETVRDALEHPREVIVARDLVGDRHRLERLAARAQERLRSAVTRELKETSRSRQAGPERAMLEDNEIPGLWVEQIQELAGRNEIVRSGLPELASARVVLEGAQGILLDEWRGFHPHTTWSTCTLEPAVELLAGHEGPVRRVGVMRSYFTRHGEGPFPTEDAQLSQRLQEPHNTAHGWQGSFRTGWLDIPLLRYALSVSGGIDGLAMTHLDRVRAPWCIAVGYERGLEIAAGPARDLGYQERLTQVLHEARPVLEAVAPEQFSARVEDLLQRPIWLTSHGPCPSDKRPRSDIFLS